MHIELVKDKVIVKIYNRSFKESTHNYLIKDSNSKEVQNNHEVIKNDLKAHHLHILRQVHGIDISEAACWKIGNEPEADGMFTTTSNHILGIQTADCVPVLLSATNGEVIGGAHCGWKSAIGGILEVLVNKMMSKTDNKLIAVIGPSIQQKSYEVDGHFYKKFLSKSQVNKKFFIPTSKDGHHYFNLPAYVKNQLNLLDIEVVHHFNDDTYALPDLYPSYRYATHHGKNAEKYKGSILSTIVIK